MSTYWYIECLDHSPALRSEDVEQHTNDFAEVRAIIESRPISPDWWDRAASHFTNNANGFLANHPECHVQLVSEYGDRDPVIYGNGATPVLPSVTDAAGIEMLPDGSVIRDRDGDVWERRASLWCSYETGAVSGERIARKWAPVTVLYRAGANQ